MNSGDRESEEIFGMPMPIKFLARTEVGPHSLVSKGESESHSINIEVMFSLRS